MSARTRAIVAATAAAAVLVPVGIATVPAETDVRPPSAGSLAPVAVTTKPTVIVISVDGFNQDALAKLPRYQTRWFRTLRTQGASTTNARTAVEQTETLPNHTGMITGRPISGASGHSITFNSDRPESWIAKENGGRYLPSIFDVAHDRGMSTALYTSKDKFKFLERSYDATNGAPDLVGPDNGRDKIDSFYYAEPDAVATRLNESLTSSHRRNLYFWHLSVADPAGHKNGFMSKSYVTAVARANALLGKILTSVQSSRTLRASTSVILTADHGGQGSSHTDASKAANYKIPFYTWGRGVAAGVPLYGRNPDRRYPYTSRLGYAGRQPIRNMDAANTSLRLLGLPALPDTAPALRTR